MLLPGTGERRIIRRCAGVAKQRGPIHQGEWRHRCDHAVRGSWKTGLLLVFVVVPACVTEFGVAVAG